MVKHKHKSAQTQYTCPDIFNRHHTQCLRRKISQVQRYFSGTYLRCKGPKLSFTKSRTRRIKSTNIMKIGLQNSHKMTTFMSKNPLEKFPLYIYVYDCTYRSKHLWYFLTEKWFPTSYFAGTKMFQQKNNPIVVCNMYN